MLDRLPDDILERIGLSVAAHDREVDDLARDAVSLSLTCKGVAPLGRALWKLTEKLAGCMNPCEECEAQESRCVRSQVVLKSHVAVLARACAIPYAKSLPRYLLDERLQESDEPVGEHCPIARSAAMYVLHMKLRRMAADDADFLFKDRDLSRCRRNGKGYLYCDLRRAPKRGPSEARLKRQQLLAAIDARFEGRKRPWHVRTQYHADALFRRERLSAEGFPRAVAQWHSEAEARKYKELCDGLGVNMSHFAHSSGPSWHNLRMHVQDRLPALFRRCADVRLTRTVRGDMYDYYVSTFDMKDVERVRELCTSRAADIADVPRDVATEARSGMVQSMPCTTRQVVSAVRLHADGLPVVPVHWALPPDELPAAAAWARDMNREFDVKVVPVFDAFARDVVTAAMANVMTPPFTRCHVESLLEKRMMSLDDIADARRQVAEAAIAVKGADPKLVAMASRTFGLSLEEFVRMVA